MVGGGGSQRLLSLNPATVIVVLLLGWWLLLGCDNKIYGIHQAEGGDKQLPHLQPSSPILIPKMAKCDRRGKYTLPCTVGLNEFFVKFSTFSQSNAF